jgi:hypothetical protein
MSEDALIRRANLKALGYTPTDLVARIGKSYQYWRDLMNTEKSFGEKTARNIEDKLGLQRGQLDLIVLDEAHQLTKLIEVKPLSMENLKEAAGQLIAFTAVPRQKQDESDHFVLPQFETGGSMGRGLLLRDQPGVIQSWQVNAEWIQKNIRSHTGAANLCIVTGFGDSMKGMFNSGDPLVVDRGVTSVEFDAVYFFRVGDEGFIKRLQRIPGEGLRVLSENQKYETWTVRSDMDFEVFGRVLKAWQGEEF